MTDAELLQRYVTVAEFISKCFGDNVEVVVHDVRKGLEQTAIAIFNSHVSGREVGAPMTRTGYQFMEEKRYRTVDRVVNYKGVTENGVLVRASTLFIKNARKRIVGFLCVNVDITMYSQAARMLRQLADFGGSISDDADDEPRPADREVFPISVADRVGRIIADFSRRCNRRPEMFTHEDKYAIVELLDREGAFLIKGGIVCAAAKLKLSEPTIYRYLKRIRMGGKNS